jgi:hypothetical protein
MSPWGSRCILRVRSGAGRPAVLVRLPGPERAVPASTMRHRVAADRGLYAARLGSTRAAPDRSTSDDVAPGPARSRRARPSPGRPSRPGPGGQPVATSRTAGRDQATAGRGQPVGISRSAGRDQADSRSRPTAQPVATSGTAGYDQRNRRSRPAPASARRAVGGPSARQPQSGGRAARQGRRSGRSGVRNRGRGRSFHGLLGTASGWWSLSAPFRCGSDLARCGWSAPRAFPGALSGCVR